MRNTAFHVEQLLGCRRPFPYSFFCFTWNKLLFVSSGGAVFYKVLSLKSLFVCVSRGTETVIYVI